MFIAGGLLRAVFFDYSDFDFGIFSDHFMNAVAVKNITTGLGWSLSGFGTFPMKPESMTTGPVVMLPVTAAVAVFGAGLTVPGIAVFFLNLIFLLLLLRKLRLPLVDEQRYYFFVALLMLLFMLFKSYYWYRLLGEITCILSVLLCAIYMHEYVQTQQRRLLIIAGVFATFALGAKMLALLALIVVIFLLGYYQWFVNRCSLLRSLFDVGIFCALTAIIPALFLSYHGAVIASQDPAWQAAYEHYTAAGNKYFSGTNTLIEYFTQPDTALDTLTRVLTASIWIGNSLFHSSIIGGKKLLPWLALYVVLCGIALYRYRQISLAQIVTLSAGPCLVWFFLLAEHSMPRHLFIGSVLVCIGAMLWLTHIESTLLRRLGALCLLALIIVTGDQRTRQLLLVWPTSLSPMHAAVLDMSDYLSRPEENGLITPVVWMSHVNNYEFEYAHPYPNAFAYGTDIIADSVELDEESYFATYPEARDAIARGEFANALEHHSADVTQALPPAKVNFVEDFTFDWVHAKIALANGDTLGVHSDKGQICQQVIYQNDAYIIERCTTDDFKALFEITGGFPMRPFKWLFPGFKPVDQGPVD